MAPNPDPEHITDEMWKLWENRPNPEWKLGGIYANKLGYHNTVKANIKKWPGNYSVRQPLDLVNKNRDKARAIDTTMSDAEMIIITKRMRNSALDPDDDRLAAVKEFYGTVDGKTVYGLNKDSTHGPWERSTADLTHLWHVHTSIFTAFVDNWEMLSPIISVWSGQTLAEWRLSKMMLPKLGDSGEPVKYWQYVHNLVRKTVSPPSPEIKVDSYYGPLTQAAIRDFWRKSGGVETFKADYLPAWLAVKYQTAFTKVASPLPPPPPVLDEAQVKELVRQLTNDWLAANVNLSEPLNLQGTITGKVTL